MAIQWRFFVLPLLTSLLCNVNALSHTRGQARLQGNGAESVESKLSNIISSSPMLSFHRDLVEIESITNDEYDVGEYVIQYLKDHDFLAMKQEVEQPDSTKKPRYNILALAPGNNPQKDEIRTLLSSHIDTVPPYIPYKLSTPSTSAFKRSDIIISGRGTVDAKACVATQVHAILDLLAEGAASPADLGLLFVVGEEVGGDGMGTFSDSMFNGQYSTVIFGEPTELKLATGHKGMMGASITAKGKAAHSGYPWLGRSANSLIIPALTIMDRIGDIPEEDGGLPRSEKYGNTTVNLGLLQGGVAANVVPELSTLTTALRLAGGTPSQVQKLITKALEPLGDDIEITWSKRHYGPVDIDADVSGFDTITVNYGTDIPALKVKDGVKRYLYGPGTITVAHSDHEALTVGDLEQAVEGYKRLILHSLK